MAFINYTTNSLMIKIVYYGPGLSGKTTNLRHIYQKIDPAARGEQARTLVDSAPLQWVGVFVDEEPRRVAAVAAALGLSAVQLHGNEAPTEVAALRAILPAGTEIWKAFGPVRVIDTDRCCSCVLAVCPRLNVSPRRS